MSPFGFQVELPSAAFGTTSSSLDLNLSPEIKYAGAGLLEPIALADQRMHCVVKQPDTVDSSQQSNKPLIDLNEGGPNVDSTVDLGDTKEAVSEWGRLLSELHDMVSYLIALASIVQNNHSLERSTVPVWFEQCQFDKIQCKGIGYT